MAATETTPAPPALSADTMCEALATTIARHPGRVALRTPDDAVGLTYADLRGRLAATASVLAPRLIGLRRGAGLQLEARW